MRLTEWINDKEDAIPRIDSNKIGHRDCMKKLAEYEDLDEQGLLLRLPCKVGDEYWRIIYEDIYCVEFVSVVTIVQMLEDGAFGKTVFFSKEEAEQALAKMKSEVK